MCNSVVTVDPVVCIVCEKDITESISDNFYRDPVQTYKQYTCPHCQSLLDVEVIPVPYFRLSIPVGRAVEARPTQLAESKAYDLSKRKAKARENCRDNLIKKYLPEEYNGKFFSKKKAGKNGYKSRIIASPTYDDMIEIELNLPIKEALQLLKQLTKEN